LTREAIENPVDKVVSAGETIHLSNHAMLVSRDGANLNITDSAAPIINNGVITGVILVFNDMTEAYKIRENLNSKEQEQREILSSLIDAVITIDEAGTVLTFNRSAETIFSYSAREVIGNSINMLMPEPDSSRHDYYVQRYCDTGESRVVGLEAGREVTAMRKNKETFPMRILMKELPKDSNGRRRFIGSCHDLTTVKHQEEQLRRSQKMDALGKLTGGVAHDFNNLLGVILGYSDLLKNQLSEQPRLVKYIDSISHAGERGAQLTKKLLSFSRTKSLEAESLNINALLLEQQDMLQKTLTVAVELSLDLDDDLWPVFVDSHDLENAILNMGINAMHAMADNAVQSTFIIQTRNQYLNDIEAKVVGLKPGDYVLLSLSDNGSGMSEDIKEKIFDPFFSTKGELGTGLGLFQIYGLVSRADGAVKVYSEPGKGSDFTLYFPRYIQSDILAADNKAIENAPLANGEKILVVDDEVALRELASELLKAQGYQVVCAENAKQALEVLERESVDLMLSDIIMPEMDGVQLAGVVQEKYPNIKIQLVSGFSGKNEDEMINDELQQNLLYKPYSSQVLFEKISSLLEKKS